MSLFSASSTKTAGRRVVVSFTAGRSAPDMLGDPWAFAASPTTGAATADASRGAAMT